jgi:hypothetical protein
MRHKSEVRSLEFYSLFTPLPVFPDSRLPTPDSLFPIFKDEKPKHHVEV